MQTESLGCPHCGAAVEITLNPGERITEVKGKKGFFDGLMALQGITVGTVECPEGDTFYAYVES